MDSTKNSTKSIKRFEFHIPQARLYASGAYSGVATHVPIPNTHVKDSSGDGTAYLTVGE